ncbi:MAG TPA: ABC transporter permease subunit [Phycisphaerae bacterium]|nr:ABC transporter permease subunit [Phycisphaerae bacterium]
MPIISRIETQSRRGRCIHAAIFLVLTVGGLTMVYPFVVMIGGSLRSEMDETEMTAVPRYLVDQDVLYRRFLEAKYNQDVSALNVAHVQRNFSFRSVRAPLPLVDRRVEDFRQFLEATPLPDHWQVLGAAYGVKRIAPRYMRQLQDRLKERFRGDIVALTRQTGLTLSSWSEVVLPPPAWLKQGYDYQDNILYETYLALLAQAPPVERQLVSVSGYFVETVIVPRYGQSSIELYNKAHRRTIESLDHFVLPCTVPGLDQPQLRAEWITFVQEELNASFVLLPSELAPSYREWLRRRYQAIGQLNRTWGTTHANFRLIPLPAGEWLRGARRMDYRQFLLEQPVERYRLAGPEYAWRQWLTGRYGSVERLNDAYQSRHADFRHVPMPVAEYEYRYTVDNSASLRRQFAARNFITVLRELFVQGRAFVNTAIFCALAIAASLLINPLAAYALSRFQLPGTYKILLLLMATMAFPPMVAMIPQFILLRELHLLNTFVALLLPVAVNGYLIFLLKGFFDSLPRELYEAARVDGASEVRMFFQITMSLSKPILAVVALQAFNIAYMMFLYALVVCPRPDMWLLSVWLYQFQRDACSSVVFASVLVASVPSLLVFVFAQNIIMRGIVVPSEK